MLPLLSLRVSYFPCYIEASLDSKLEHIFFQKEKKTKKKKSPKIFQSILFQMDKYNLFLSTNILLFYVLIILIHHFVLFFSILSQKKKFYVKRKTNTQSSCITFFPYFLSDAHIFQETHYLSKWYHSEYKQHVIYYSAIQSSI